MEDQDFPVPVLNLCSSLTPLVEPQGKGQVYLDISGCGRAGKILTPIAAMAYQESHTALDIGLATSRLLASSAVGLRQFLRGNRIAPVYRCLERPEYRLVQVLPGHEQAFLRDMPLKDFTPLAPQDVRRLNRAGLYRVGDLAALSPAQLYNLLGKSAYLLHEYSRGIDRTPVMGLYPPEHIIYPLDFSEGCDDLLKIEQLFKIAAHTLASTLTARDCGFTVLRLSLLTSARQWEMERNLSQPCFGFAPLVNMALQLLAKSDWNEPLLGCTIKLSGLVPLLWEEADLFAPRPLYDQERQPVRLNSVLDKLKQRFPHQIFKGREINRREQQLAFRDPWRFKKLDADSADLI